MNYLIEGVFLAVGLGAIILSRLGLKRTARDVYRVMGILTSLICGWCCFWIVASWFVPVMASYIFFANPLLFLVTILLWFSCGAHARKKIQ